MEDNYKIEKSVEMPNRRWESKYPFNKMDVGDSFIVGDYSRKNMTKFGNAARNWSVKGEHGCKFSMRKTADNKIRIWRIS